LGEVGFSQFGTRQRLPQLPAKINPFRVTCDLYSRIFSVQSRAMQEQDPKSIRSTPAPRSPAKRSLVQRSQSPHSSRNQSSSRNRQGPCRDGRLRPSSERSERLCSRSKQASRSRTSSPSPAAQLQKPPPRQNELRRSEKSHPNPQLVSEKKGAPPSQGRKISINAAPSTRPSAAPTRIARWCACTACPPCVRSDQGSSGRGVRL
jgi:hypothetical protein